jgi:hypothetical protein
MELLASSMGPVAGLATIAVAGHAVKLGRLISDRMTIREKIRSAWRWFCRQFWWDETLGPMMWPQIGLPVAAAFLAVWGVLVVRACHGH